MKAPLLALVLTNLALSSLALPSLAVAQVNPAFSDLNEATEEARSVMQTERRTIVAQGLALTVDEEKAFWPVYDRYMADMKAASDLRVKVITDYAASYDNLSDDTARQLLENYLKYQSNTLDIRKSYVRKFRKVLPEIKLARFYQIENKIDSITNFVLAREIPLVPTAPSSAPIAPPAR
jgi:hypothetical protein